MADDPPNYSARDSLSVPKPKRPSNSRQHSSTTSVASVSSAHSHFRRQPREYVATGVQSLGGEPGPSDEGAWRWMYDNEEHLTGVDDGEGEGGDVSDSEQEEDATSPSVHQDDQPDHDEEWELARTGSIARRPAWRRPKPLWIYPFIVAATLSMSMGSAPRSEVYINLACLAHPPRQPSSVEGIDMSSFGDGPSIDLPDTGVPLPSAIQTPWIGSEVKGNASIPTVPNPQEPRSEADEWFLKLQKQIYDWEKAHLSHSVEPEPYPSSSTAAPTRSTVMPSGPLPHPTDRGSDPSQGDEPGENPSLPTGGAPDRSPGTNHPPFHAIDPALCKRDPQVQAAAARLTMSACSTF